MFDSVFPFLRISMSFRRRLALALVLLSVSAMLNACADVRKSPAEKAEFEATDDPLEPMNRTIFDVNDFLDRLLFRPLAELYRYTIPPGIRDRIADITTKMDEPVIFANNLMQGEFGKAETTI